MNFARPEAVTPCLGCDHITGAVLIGIVAQGLGHLVPRRLPSGPSVSYHPAQHPLR